MYSIEFSISAEKTLFKLDRNVQERIILALERIRFRPFGFVKKLVGSTYYRLKVGEYRIILDVQGNRLLIFIVYIGHRKSIYKKLK